MKRLMGLILLGIGFGALAVQAADRPNVLFIIGDDLRPELNCYGKTHMVTPNIDSLAEKGVLFERAYCQMAICSSSRPSFMTSLYPTQSRFNRINVPPHADDANVAAPGIPTLPELFRSAGYRTAGAGKVFHEQTDSVEHWDTWYGRGQTKTFDPATKAIEATGAKLAYERCTSTNYLAYDAYTKIVANALTELQQAKTSGEPLFFAAGFTKPHLGFYCPDEYWAHYDAMQPIPFPADYLNGPTGAPVQSIHKNAELRGYDYHILTDANGKGQPKTDEIARNLIQGYYASVTFTDHMIGLLFDEMDRLSLWDNTIVVVTGDHGWQLGDHSMWVKHTCYDTSLHVPLIIYAPNMESNKVTSAITELVDIYPTLCDLTGIPIPQHVQGKSLVPVLEDTTQRHKDSALAIYWDGESIITDDYIYTEYYDYDQNTSDPVTRTNFVARMLYDHKVDGSELSNVSEDPAYSALVAQLSQELKERHEALDIYTLSYKAQAGGIIAGPSSQSVALGRDGYQVWAVPTEGWEFVEWSDGSTDNPREDLNISSDLYVTAAFNNKNDQPVAVTDSSIQLYLKFDGNFDDSSMHSSQNVMSNVGVLTYEVGVRGQAAKFAGSTRIMATGSPIESIDDNDEVSVAFWLKSPDYTAGTQNIFDGFNTSNASVITLRAKYDQTSASGPRMRCYSPLSVQAYYNIPNATPSDDLWHHWVLVRDVAAGTIEVFMDGASVSKVSGVSTSMGDVINQIRVGQTSTGGSKLVAQLDEFIIYDRAIDAAAVSTLYNSYPAPNSTPDSDNDGMLDSWESANGLNPSSDDRALDLDGDGVSNFDEFIAGTDPDDDTSVQVIEVHPKANQKVELTWPGGEERIYAVEKSHDLKKWKQDGYSFFSDGVQGMAEVDMSTNETATFYRIKTIKP